MSGYDDSPKDRPAGPQPPGGEGAVSPESIDLVALGVLTWRSKWLFLCVFLVTAGIFVAIGFTRPDVYRFTAVMRVGTINALSTAEPVPPTHSVVTQLQQVYVPRVLAAGAARQGKLRNLDVEVSAGTGNDNTVTLSTTAPLSEEKAVVALLAGMVRATVKDANGKLDTYVAGERRYLNQQLTAVSDRIAQLEKQAEQLDRGGGDAAAAAGYAAGQVAQLVTLEGTYREQLVQLPVNVEHAGLVGKPVRSILPVGFRRIVWILLGIVVGLVLGGAAVIAARFVANVRRRLLQPGT